MDEPEREVAALDNYYLWRRPRPGFTILDAHRGRLLLTNKRLVFLSVGKGGFFDALFGITVTRRLDMSALGNRGSLSLRFDRIERASVARRIDFAWYLKVQAGETWTFMSKIGFDHARLTAFYQALEAERVASRA